MKNPERFYTDILMSLSKIAMDKGRISKELSVVPELIVEGEKYILNWFRNDAFQKNFKDDVTNYYYNIAIFSFCGGVYYARAWNIDFSSTVNGTAQKYLYENGVIETACEVLDIQDSSDKDTLISFIGELFKEWLNCMEPYWELRDARGHTLKGMLAVFCIGVAVQMEMMGF